MDCRFLIKRNNSKYSIYSACILYTYIYINEWEISNNNIASVQCPKWRNYLYIYIYTVKIKNLGNKAIIDHLKSASQHFIPHL